MSTTAPTVPGLSSPPAIAASPELVSNLYLMTVRKFDEMVADGLVTENDRVELIEGLVVNKMSRKRPHVVAGKKGLRVLSRVIPEGWHVAKEDPIVVSDWSKPEPDLAVIRGKGDDYLDRDVMAADVALLIEIAETSLSIDRTDMARVYAESGIPTYWIVNLLDQQVEVYTEPGPGGYQSSEFLTRGQYLTVVIDGAEAGRIAVTDLLP
jgi:Uma2 family endonuclease